MNEFFIRNLAVFSEEEQALLKEKKVLVAGCGGLGSSVIEILVRSGIGHLVLVDRDVFEPSNMNRQILCTMDTLGKSKAETAAMRAASICPEIDVRPVHDDLNEKNARSLVRGCDLVIDALDSISARLVLEDACAQEGVYLVHGAVSGWMLQTGICPPGAGMLHSIYSGGVREGATPGGIAMTVFTCASFEVSEGIKFLLGRPETLTGKLLFFDMISKESQTITFSDPDHG